MSTGLFTPAPGRAPVLRILGRYTRLEMILTLRRGQAVVFTLAIPLLAIVSVGLTDVINLPTTDRLGFVVPGAIALSVMSNAFTSLAIGTAYERAYGALKRLGASPLTRLGLILGKIGAVLMVTVGQALVLAAIGFALGWRPTPGGIPAALGISVLAVAAFAGLGLLLAARLRPETATGAATVLYVVLLAVSGVMFPLPELGRAELLNPLAAYAETLRETLSNGNAAEPWAWYGLGLWAVLSVYAAALGFRWE
jgi:ABC-2 type transport system permease protein